MSVKWFVSSFALFVSVFGFCLAAGCSSTTASNSGSGGGVSYAISLTVATPAGLPTCTQALDGQVAFVSSPASLWTCDEGNWRPIVCSEFNVGAVGFANTDNLFVACIDDQWIAVHGPQGPQGPQGPVGPAGPKGAPGATSLIKLTQVGPNTQCSVGGTEVQVGIDTNGDGVLEPSEVQQTSFVCNGTPGSAPSADLSVAAAISNSTPNVGDQLTLTVDVANLGPQDATGVNLSVVLPAGVNFVSATPGQGMFNSTTGVWTVGTVPSGQTFALQVGVVVVSTASQTLTASIAHSDQSDPDPGNNSASVTETPQQADLQVTVTAPSTAAVGQQITVAFGVSNLGPQGATGVTLSAPLPAGVNFVSATPPPGTSYDSATGAWSVGLLASGTTLTLSVTVVIASSAIQTFTVAVSHADQFDPSTANNSASASVN
jgi:uncharacterized repeat protein (TIGR01451 family)